MTHAAAPDLHATAELSCPLCGYNLRGLTEPRCPECGFAFTWAELLDAKRDQHPWLFEHGRGRNVRTFLATYARTSVPRRFWRTVTPANPVHVGRLLLYWLAGSAALLLVLAVPLVRVAVDLARADVATRAGYRPTPGQPGHYDGPPLGPFATYYGLPAPATTVTEAQLDAAAPRLLSAGFLVQLWDAWQPFYGTGPASRRRRSGGPSDDTGNAAAVVLAWPWLSMAAMLVFQASMRRAKVRPAHVLRATLYGCDFGLWVVLAAVVLYGPTFQGGLPMRSLYLPRSVPLAMWLPRGPLSAEALPALLAVAVCTVAATYRLSVAYGRYLRFDRPLLTVLAGQAMVVLVVAVVLSRTVRLF
jgi:hypothetical protein